MSDGPLLRLAQAAGVAPRWKDVHGAWHDVSPDTLRAVLDALSLPSTTPSSLADSFAALADMSFVPPLLTAEVGYDIAIPAKTAAYKVELQSGRIQQGIAAERRGVAIVSGIGEPGYHTLHIGGHVVQLAVAPSRCCSIADVAPGQRPWALAVQLYALRRDNDGGLGDFEALSAFAVSAARHGAAGVAISPVHAQFSADPDRFSPYSPSSRLMLNVLHTGLDVPPDEHAHGLGQADLVDWPAVGRKRLQMMRAQFDALDRNDMAGLDAYRQEQGRVLETHARFEVLHAHLFGADRSCWHWRNWPDQFRRPENAAVSAFAADQSREVAFHAYMQMRAERSLAGAQAAARAAGMPIGLIADLAVGADSGGSHCWSRQDETLLGLSIGAPPDLLSPHGQNWGLAAFSPLGLVRHGFGAYLDMLRSAMRHAGGVRIDHAMGLARLWVVPDGGTAADGAYMHFPVKDMLRLIALESHLHRTVVLGEDLGTVPEGFDTALSGAGIMGLRVLWFERNQAGFKPPSAYTPTAAAVTTTHDLPTVAGWWTGTDLAWRHRLGLFGSDDNDRTENEARTADRHTLWAAMQDAGAADGPAPAPDQPGAVVDAAIRFIGAAQSELVVLPIEDALAEAEQPNLPGTLDQHPNWRRRHPAPAATVLDDPAVSARLRALSTARATGQSQA